MRAWHCPYLIEKTGRRYDRLRKLGFVSHFSCCAQEGPRVERIGFVGLRGWILYVYENKIEIAYEQPMDGFVSHFFLFRASDAVTEHTFSLSDGGIDEWIPQPLATPPLYTHYTRG
jgi:hypothetical protein